MSDWENFEIDSTNYLNENFGNLAFFERQGGADSTVADILVSPLNKTKEFYIEAKKSPAQCGQFVLIPNINTQEFEFSEKNINKYNQNVQIIINHMNENFEEFKDAGTAGKNIIFDNCQEVFSNIIKGFYEDKNAKYLITNDYLIIPMSKIGESFKIDAKYRIKRSGSSSVSKSRLELVIQYIKNNYITDEIYSDGRKLYVKSNEELLNHKFLLNGNEYMFSERDKVYEIRQLSNTFNANVIFSIKLLKTAKNMSEESLREVLENG